MDWHVITNICSEFCHSHFIEWFYCRRSCYHLLVLDTFAFYMHIYIYI
jgi:hypothetical protein